MADDNDSSSNNTFATTTKTDTNTTISWRQIQQRAFSAMLGSTLVSLTVTPLDVVKVRLQAQQPDSLIFCGHWFDRLQKACPSCAVDAAGGVRGRMRIRGTVDGIVRIGREEGVKALYRGLVPTMVMAVPANVVYFVAYESLRDTLYAYNNNQVMPQVMVPTVAGAAARVFAAAVVSPLELIKTRMQHQNRDIINMLSHIVGMVRVSGPSVLFRGLVPTLWRDVPFSGIYWTGYELFKRRLNTDTNDVWRQLWGSFAAGTMAGSIAAVLTIPFDVVKTRKQVDLGAGMWSNGSLLSHLRLIYQEEGWRGVTRGVVPRVGKVAPACAIMISSYEVGKRCLS